MLHETLQQGKFEGADFKYDNVFSKLVPKKLKLGFFFLIPNLGILIFAQNFSITQFGGRLLEIWQ